MSTGIPILKQKHGNVGCQRAHPRPHSKTSADLVLTPQLVPARTGPPGGRPSPRRQPRGSSAATLAHVRVHTLPSHTRGGPVTSAQQTPRPCSGALLARVSPSPCGTSYPLPTAPWTSPPAPRNVSGLLATLVPTAGGNFPPDDRAQHEVSVEADGVDSSSAVTDRQASRSGSALDFVTVSSGEGRAHGKCSRHISQTESQQVGLAPQTSKTP